MPFLELSRISKGFGAGVPHATDAKDATFQSLRQAIRDSLDAILEVHRAEIPTFATLAPLA